MLLLGGHERKTIAQAKYLHVTYREGDGHEQTIVSGTYVCTPKTCCISWRQKYPGYKNGSPMRSHQKPCCTSGVKCDMRNNHKSYALTKPLLLWLSILNHICCGIRFMLIYSIYTQKMIIPVLPSYANDRVFFKCKIQSRGNICKLDYANVKINLKFRWHSSSYLSYTLRITHNNIIYVQAYE